MDDLRAEKQTKTKTRKIHFFKNKIYTVAVRTSTSLTNHTPYQVAARDISVSVNKVRVQFTDSLFRSRFCGEERCVTSLKTAAKETSSLNVKVTSIQLGEAQRHT